MRAQLKVVLLVAVVLIATVSAVVWKTQGLLIEDKIRFVNDSALKQIAPLKRLVSEKVENLKTDLVRFATTREAQGAGHASAYGKFDVVALLESTASSQWTPTWIEKGPNVNSEKWPAGYDVTLLKSLPYAKVKDGTALWVRLSDAQGSPIYAILVSVEVQSADAPSTTLAATPAPRLKGEPLPEGTTAGTATAAALDGSFAVSAGPRRAVVVGFASENPLASLTEDYIGSINSVFILDDRAYVASHVDKAYLGSLFSEDSIAKEIMKGQKLSDTGEFEDMQGRPVIAHFERIENTNLTAVISTPVSAATAVVDESLRTSILVAVSVGFLGLVLAWLVGSSIAGQTMVALAESGKYSDRRQSGSGDEGEDQGDDTLGASLIDESIMPYVPPSAKESAPQATAPPVPPAVESQRLQDERKFAFQALHASLAARLREPLLAVLGHVQLVKSKTADEAVLAHADSIEREARLAKDAIEHWQILEETPSLVDTTENVDLEKVALSALADKAIELDGSGVDVTKDTNAVPFVKGRAKDIETAIGNMIENAIEAMRDQSRRRLALKLTTVGSTIRLSLEDTGVGMSRDVREKVFEPFYKGFQSPRHMGLGLSFVQNTVKRSGGTVEVESSPGEGARFILKFPIDAEAKRAFDAQRAPVATAPTTQAVPAATEVIEPAPTAASSPVASLPATEFSAAPSFKLGGREAIADDEEGTEETPFFPSAPVDEDAAVNHADKDDDDEFKSVPVSEPGIEFQVKIRRPKPKGQS